MRAAALVFTLVFAPLGASAQMLVSTGAASGARIYQTNSNDWWIDPSQGRFDLRVNGGATPVMKVDSAGGVTSSSQTLTGGGTGTPFALTTSSGVHVLSGKLKLEQGAWIEYGDGSVATSTSTAGSATVVVTSSISVNLNGISVTNSAFTIAVETLTITTSGLNPVMVCYSGAAYETGANGGTSWSFLVDGGYVEGMSSSIGVCHQGDYVGSGWTAGVCNGCYPVSAGTFSAGSHKFAFIPKGNNGGAVKLGYIGSPASVSVAKFYVYELGGSASTNATSSSTSSGAVISSGVVQGANFTISNNTSWTPVTGMSSTITLTSPSTAYVAVNCGWARTGGSYIGTLSGRINLDNGSQYVYLADLGGTTASQTTNITLGAHGATLFNLGATSHNFSYEVKTTANTDSWATTANQCQLIDFVLGGSSGGSSSSSSGSSSGSQSATVASTQSFIAAGSALTNASTFLGCLSTVTFTTGNNSVFIWGSGSTNPNVTWNNSYIWALLDGQFIGGATASVPNVQTQAATSGYQTDASFGMAKSGVSAGQHSLCIGASGNGGTATFATVYNYGAYEIPTTAGLSNGASSSSIAWVMISSQDVTNVTASTFTGLASSTTYKLLVTAAQTTAQGAMYFRFNGDSGTNYKWEGTWGWQDPNWTYSGQNTGTYCRFDPTSYTAGVPVNEGREAEFTFRTNPVNSTQVLGHTNWVSYGDYVNASLNGGQTGCRYSGSSNLSSLSVQTTAGGFTGHLELWQAQAGGAATLGSNQTFTGAQTFTSTVVVLGSSNFCIEIASADVVNVTSATFSGLASSVTYRLDYLIKQVGSPVVWGAIFNSDLAANYNDANNASWNTSNWPSNCSTSANCAYGIPLARYNGNGLGAGAGNFGSMTFTTNYGNTKMLYWADTTGDNVTFGANRYTEAGTYNGTATTISLIGSSSDYSSAWSHNVSFNGHLELWQCGYKRN